MHPGIFWAELRNQTLCGCVALSDIIKLTAAHYFGIVPLHVNREHQAAYLQTASALISSLAANEYLQDQ